MRRGIQMTSLGMLWRHKRCTANVPAVPANLAYFAPRLQHALDNSQGHIEINRDFCGRLLKGKGLVNDPSLQIL
jgi:hypothetical protein